jgi:hypothetical protein
MGGLMGLVEEIKPDSLRGIRGWLIFPLLGLIINPFRVSFFLYKHLWPIFSKGFWEVLTTPESKAYHPLWAPVLILEMTGNLAIIALGIVALWYFLRKSRLAPRLLISWLGLILVVVWADHFLANLIPAVAKQSHTESIKEIARAVLGAAIWIPYFLVSKRVKATFVN